MAMAMLWRVRWQWGERSGTGTPMARAAALRNAERSNAIDPTIRHWAEPISAAERRQSSRNVAEQRAQA
jgi:hypothetical protein